MRATRTLLAKASTVGTPSGGLGVVPHALLPPIPLYRRLLRGHRKHLPPEMRVLGDEYVKAEFRAHRGVDNPIHIIGFLTEWQGYAQQIEGEKWRGDKMDKAKIDKMSDTDEQIAQMYELMQAIRKQELEDNDPEFQAAIGKGEGEKQ
ncbi:ACN9-domain-containing protein [Aureobasidium namibiae CBS 147.97]|uniref:Succinate dehydrogenase assembly factor 3 n=1 Tax=Aureobasidium namibiae CBS 147.97 TaxID=1043004 RepID=A0A074W8T7_9PEZI